MDRQIYAQTLAWLSEKFDGKVVVNATDIAIVFKIDPRTVRARYPLRDNKIEITRLAVIMCENDQKRK